MQCGDPFLHPCTPPPTGPRGHTLSCGEFSFPFRLRRDSNWTTHSAEADESYTPTGPPPGARDTTPAVQTHTRGAPRGWSPLRPVPGGTSGPTMPCPGHYRGLPVGLVPWVRSRPPTSAGPPAWTREPKPRVRVGSALISDLQRIPWTPGQGARGPGRCGPLRRHPRGGEAHAWSARWAWLPSAPCPAPPPRPVNRGD